MHWLVIHFVIPIQMSRVKSTLLIFAAVICTTAVQGQFHPHGHHGIHGAHHSHYSDEHHYEESPCALIVPGLGKSSHADRFNNIKWVPTHSTIKSIFSNWYSVSLISARYQPDETCITFEAVDRAFESAKNKMRLPNTKSHTLTDSDIDHLANVIIETTRILSNQ